MVKNADIYTTPRSIAAQVLGALETAAETSEGRLGFGLKASDWSAREEFNKLSCQNLFDSKTICQLSSVQHRMEYIVQLSRQLAASASEVLQLFERHLEPVVSKLSRGIASLPDELLALIFRFATDHKQHRTRHTIWLSQVSRRFRIIALGDRSLWTTQLLCLNLSKQMVEECIRRSGTDADLQIIISDNRTLPFFAIDDFVDVCLPSVARWETLTLVCNWNDEEDNPNQDFRVEELLGGLTRNLNLVLPRLHELHLIQHHCSGPTDSIVWTPSAEFTIVPQSWVTPNLRTVRCTQYIPPQSFPFAFVTHFALSIALLPGDIFIQVEDLLFFLASANRMSELDLDLSIHDNADLKSEGELEIGPLFSCSHLVSFKLQVSGLALPNGIYWLLHPFIRALQMPVLEHLSLSVALGFFDICYYGATIHEPGLLSALIHNLLPDPITHTRLTSLTVNVLFPGVAKEHVHAVKRMLLTIPLDRLPRVSTLTVSTFCRVSFSRQDDPRPKKRYLRELRLHSCENIVAGNLLSTIRSLKDVDAWGVLDRVVIQNCASLDYDAALIVVGKERLRFTS